MRQVTFMLGWLQQLVFIVMMLIAIAGFCIAPAQTESWIASIYENIAQT